MRMRPIEHVLGAFATLDLHADVAEGLRELHGRGTRMATLTNGSAAIPESLLSRAGVDDVMERFLSVDDAGIWKPHPDSYRYAVETMGAAAADTMLVAAHPWDIDGASRAGLATAYVDRKGLPVSVPFQRGLTSRSSLVTRRRSRLTPDVMGCGPE